MRNMRRVRRAGNSLYRLRERGRGEGLFGSRRELASKCDRAEQRGCSVLGSSDDPAGGA